MVQRLIAILLIGSLCAENVSRLLVTTAFELNRDYITAYFCVNRDKPLLHCDGQCFLAKKLQEVEEKEKKSEKESQKTSYQPAVFTEKHVLFFPSLPAVTHQTRELPFALPTQAADIFHPPRI
ncbi:hypothetical protein SAMN05421747_101427 [Parapedobacter composti]|uniref:Uncharacterized protein n=1 Tax=Parapedobacter composti TaxID=623281 RepID=A0A1I1EFD5_9SPHI|nr:hypothetical protein [Parapedobacter composti]SFB83700.1 hypothetical protein SAMN05421747_101427 [Parapedobacter composti]